MSMDPTPFLIAAYALTGALAGVIIAVTWWRARVAKRQLDALEAQGAAEGNP